MCVIYLHYFISFYFSTPKKEFFFAERTRGYIANIGPSCECASMIKMHLNSIRSDLLCTGPTSDACKESRPQPTSQIDDVTVLLNVFSFISLFFENL